MGYEKLGKAVDTVDTGNTTSGAIPKIGSKILAKNLVNNEEK